MTASVLQRLSAIAKVPPHLRRQILATIAACLLSMTGGITFGCTAVLLPQLKEDLDYPYDANFDSWIASILPMAMMMGSLISGSMSDGFGRRKGQMILIFPYILGWVVVAFAFNNTIMMVGRFITGICVGATRPLSLVYLGELSEPKHRSVTLLFPSLAVYIGVLISHVLGKYVYWRYASFLFSLPNLLCFFMLIYLKESPLWLISKGKIDEGIASFNYFRGVSETADVELKSVLEKQAQSETTSSFKSLLDAIFTKAFLKSITSVLLLFIAVQFSGINTITFYAQDIFKSTFEGEVDAFMMMLVTDALRIIIAFTICLLANKIPRRTTFLVSCYGTSFILVCFLVYIYIKPEGFTWLAILCLVLYIGIAGAVTCTSWSFVAEIFPSKIRGLGSGISSLISFSLLFISVKVTPDIIANLGIFALYLSFAIVTLFSGIFLTFLLPETSGKSLQDIENSMYDKDNKTPEVLQTRM